MNKISDDFEKIKAHLNITWEYDDEQILEIVNEGVAKIGLITGQEDFTDPFAFSLLKEYCRYSWNGVKLYFEENYKRELLQLQLKVATESGANI